MVGKRSVIKHRLLTVALNVSFTDVKAEINMLDTLQFLFVAHMCEVQGPAQRRLLDHFMCWKNEERSVCLGRLIPMSRVSSGDWGSHDQ